MGVDQKVHNKLGPTPHWATTLGPNDIPAKEFLNRLHCLMPLNGGARENWPRVGLEAFAAGVPVVAQNMWGWKEMIVHGETGFLGDSDEELAHWASVLAWDDELRQHIAEQARYRLENELACPDEIAKEWDDVFSSLAELETVRERPQDTGPLPTVQ